MVCPRNGPGEACFSFCVWFHGAVEACEGRDGDNVESRSSIWLVWLKMLVLFSFTLPYLTLPYLQKLACMAQSTASVLQNTIHLLSDSTMTTLVAVPVNSSHSQQPLVVGSVDIGEPKISD